MGNNNIAKPKASLVDYLTAPMVKTQIANVIGKTNSQRFISSLISAVQTNPQLASCTQKSLVNCGLLGESFQLSHSPQFGQYFMVPYNNKGTMEAVFQLGYKGYVTMAIRTGEYEKITVLPIKEGELKSWNPLEEEINVELISDELKREKAKTIGYYGMFKLKNGFKKSMYWTYDKMLEHANKYSKGFSAKKGFTFWEKDFDAMAQKTLIRQLISKWGIMSTELQRAYKADMAVISSDIKDTTSDFEVDYVDNPEQQFNPVTGEIIETTAKVVEKATPAQIEKIKELVDIPNATQILKYYDVENFDDLNVEQASEVLKNLTAKM